MTAYQITFEENPLPADLKILDEGISQYNQTKLTIADNKSQTFFLRDEEGVVVGGVHGNYGGDWLYISTLWVSDQAREGGYGSQLMQLIEEAAMKGGCKNAYLDTFSYQAPEFYKKLGYTIFAELEDFPAGHSRIFLRKRLIQQEGASTHVNE